MRLRSTVPGIALLLALPLTAAAVTTFNVSLDGSQEVGAGDPSGFGSGTISFDPDADTISWEIDYFDLSDDLIYPYFLSGWHIHGPDGTAGSNAPVLVNLGNLAGLGLPSGTLSGTISAPSDDIDAVLANPGDFYLNLHTDDGFGGIFGSFNAGAIRGQIPEPGTGALLVAGLVSLGLTARRR